MLHSFILTSYVGLLENVSKQSKIIEITDKHNFTLICNQMKKATQVIILCLTDKDPQQTQFLTLLFSTKNIFSQLEAR